TSRLRRRAMMSISPTGLFQRRARMRKPLATRTIAARLSAEMPVRNAIWRSGRGAGRNTGRASGGRSSVTAVLRAQGKGALIHRAARQPRDGGDFRNGRFDRVPFERLAQEPVELLAFHHALL